MDELEKRLSHMLARESEQADPATSRLRNPAQAPQRKRNRAGTPAAVAIGIALGLAVASAFVVPRLTGRQEPAATSVVGQVVSTQSPTPSPIETVSSPGGLATAAVLPSETDSTPEPVTSMSPSESPSATASPAASGASSGRASRSPRVEAALLEYQACMEGYGFKREFHPSNPAQAISNAMHDSSPAARAMLDRYRIAQDACVKPDEQGGESVYGSDTLEPAPRESESPKVRAAARSFSKCMKGYGFEGLTHPHDDAPQDVMEAEEDSSPASVDLSNRWKAAWLTCVKPYHRAVDEEPRG